MFSHLAIGASAVTILWLLVGCCRRRYLHLVWWQWALIGLGVAYGAFICEILVALIDEGSPRAAAVVGSVLALVGLIAGLVVWRAAFKGRLRGDSPKVTGSAHAD